MARVWILLALLFSLLASACGGGGERATPTPEGQPRASGGTLPGAGATPTPTVRPRESPGPLVYARTPTYVVRFDLTNRTVEAQELPAPLSFPVQETAVVAEDKLVFAGVSRSEGALFGGDNEWIVTLHVFDGAAGREHDQLVLDPLRDVRPVPSDSQDCFCSVGSVSVWYVPQTQTLLVGMAITQNETRSFRLDVIDADELFVRRSIDLGDLPALSYGSIHVATDVAGNVAVLLAGSPRSRLLAGPPNLSSLSVADEAIADCSTVEAASTNRSQSRYFLCLGPPQDTTRFPVFPASMLVVDRANGARQYPLPPRFSQNLQAGTADIGDRVFIGTVNPLAPTVLTFDLTAGKVAAEREFESLLGPSWRDRLKRFFFGQPAYAATVVFKPIVASPDGMRLFFTDGFKLWCLRPDDLSVIGQVELKGTQTQVLAVTADGRHVVAAGVDEGIEVIDGERCRSADSLEYARQYLGEGTQQILVP